MDRIVDKYFDLARRSELTIDLRQIELQLGKIALLPSSSIVKTIITKNYIIMSSIPIFVISSILIVLNYAQPQDVPARHINATHEVKKSATLKSQRSINSGSVSLLNHSPAAEQLMMSPPALQKQPPLNISRGPAIFIPDSTEKDAPKDTSEANLEDSLHKRLIIQSESPDSVASVTGIHKCAHHHVKDSADHHDEEHERHQSECNPETHGSYGFDKFYGFRYNYDLWAKILIDGYYGMVNTDMKVVVQPIYGKIEKTYRYNDELWCLVERDGYYGFIDRNGKEIVEAKYEKVWDFKENDGMWAKVKRDGYYFFLDRDGTELKSK
jgi:hypothetical protein